MFWRAAGLTYVAYSRIAARTVRKCTKVSLNIGIPPTKLKMTPWENGKMIKNEQ
uniref:ATP synthase subunit epsilon, mitochondrial n=1 Tax=Parastrongyloides trichosuri TaxID=131310 RepID=A0A0N5A257_PARTI